jgi:hypothetical protein
MDHGILLISEDDLDDFFEAVEDPSMPLDLMSGVNIKTSCYGLFLVGLELAEDVLQRSLIGAALKHINNLSDSVAFHALSLMYPVDDISPQGILKVAKAIILIDSVTYGREAEDVEPDTADTLMLAISKTLGLRANVIEMVNDYDETNNEPETSRSVREEIQGAPGG